MVDDDDRCDWLTPDDGGWRWRCLHDAGHEGEHLTSLDLVEACR